MSRCPDYFPQALHILAVQQENSYDTKALFSVIFDVYLETGLFELVCCLYVNGFISTIAACALKLLIKETVGTILAISSLFTTTHFESPPVRCNLDEVAEYWYLQQK